jgi:hypothetical protein
VEAQSRLRSLFQANDVGFIFSKSMPWSGHRFLTECLTIISGRSCIIARGPWREALRQRLIGSRMPDAGDAGAQTRRRHYLGLLDEPRGDAAAADAQQRRHPAGAVLKPDMLIDRPQQRRGDAQQAVKLPCRAAPRARISGSACPISGPRPSPFGPCFA